MQISAGDDNLSDTALDSRLQKDLKRLRDTLGCMIVYDRSSNRYQLESVDLPLIDISPEAAQGLAFLRATFHRDAPMGAAVEQLLDEISSHLPPERQQDIGRKSRLLLIGLTPKDTDTIPDEVWDKLDTACSMRRLLEFDYHSPGHIDRQPRRNLVEPYRYYFDTQRGHYYLDAFCREVSGPKGDWARQDFAIYRLGRIRNPVVLPQRFVPRQRKAVRYELIYDLNPEIARYGVTRHFPDCEITRRDDGSARVHARVADLFMPLKTLLHYGPGCRVVGGEEAVGRMRDLVKGMWEMYRYQ